MLLFKTDSIKYRPDCAEEHMNTIYQENLQFRFFKGYSRVDFAPHSHGAVEVFYFLEGETTAQCGTQKYRLGAGDIFIAFPNQIHGYEESKNAYVFNMIIYPKPWLMTYYKLLTEKIPVFPYLKKGSFEHTGLPQLFELAWQDQASVSKEILQGYLTVIFGKLLGLLELQDAKNDAARDMLMYIHEHYDEPITRGDIARALGYTESYISHLFSDTMKTSIPDYINALRIENAKELLSTTEMSVSDIVASLGFGSLRNFSRAFRKHTSSTPRDYRKMARNQSSGRTI